MGNIDQIIRRIKASGGTRQTDVTITFGAQGIGDLFVVVVCDVFNHISLPEFAGPDLLPLLLFTEQYMTEFMATYAEKPMPWVDHDNLLQDADPVRFPWIFNRGLACLVPRELLPNPQVDRAGEQAQGEQK